MRKLIAAAALMAAMQGAATAAPASGPEAAYDPALRELADAFEGAGLNAVRLNGRSLSAGLMLAQQQPSAIDTTPTDPNAPDPTIAQPPPGEIGSDPSRPTTTTTTTTAQTQTRTQRWYDPTWVKVVVAVVGVVAIAILVDTVDDDDEPAPAGTGGN